MSGPGLEPVPNADPFEYDDAAYVLGALGGADRAAFEAHLVGCAACSARVRRLRPVVGELVAAGAEAHDALMVGSATRDGAARPSRAAQTAAIGAHSRDDRVAQLAELVERRRRRTRWAFGGLASVAAATIAALAIAVAAPSPSPAVPAAAQQMTSIGAAKIRATAAIAAMPWGSEITIDCDYVGSSRYASSDVYTLEVVDLSGRSHAIGSWTLARSTQARFTSGTALAPGEIRAVNVAKADGTVVLRLTG